MTDDRTDPKNPPAPSASPPAASPPIDEELERERLEPGLNTGGTGGVGAEPGRRKGHDNSNT